MWHRSIIDTVKQGEQRGMCLYGAGFWGDLGYQIVSKLGAHPLCYCDDDQNKQGTSYNGLPVCSLESAVKQYPNAVYLVCIDSMRKNGDMNRNDLSLMLKKLQEYGVYDSNCELRLALYLFLLDIPNLESIVPDVNTEELIGIEDIKNLLILNHMSNSGSYYFEQLLDGHPEILCLPYSSHVFRIVYEKRLQYLEGDELLVEMGAQMLGYFRSKYSGLECVIDTKFHGFCVDKQGGFIEKVWIEPEDFMCQLKTLLRETGVKLHSFGHMMKVLVAAYNNCLGKKRQRNVSYWLFYHMHQADYDVKETYKDFNKEEFERIENLIIIREPVQQCYSYIRRMVIKGRDVPVLTKDEDFIHTLQCELGLTLEKQTGIDNVKVIRFEDLKYDSENTLRALCKWMGIAYSQVMGKTTLNGIDIYFPIYSSEGIKYITGNDTSTVSQTDFSEVLTLWDEARLNILCSKFKRALGYTCSVPDFDMFSTQFREELLKADFKFCDIVQKVLDEDGLAEDRYDVNEYVKELYRSYMDNYKSDTVYYDYIKPERE